MIIASSSLNNMANDNQNNNQSSLIQNQLQCLQNIYSLTIDHITNNEIIEFKHSINKISSLTSQDENDTEYIIYSGIQNLLQDKESYPTINIPLLHKQVALQLAMNKYIEFQPIYQPMVK